MKAWRRAVFAAKTVGAVTSITLAATIACADMTGSFTGQLRVKRPPQVVDVAAAFTDAGGALAGTVVLDVSDPVGKGAYLVQGRRQGKRINLQGINPAGARVFLRGIAGADSMRGRLRLRMGEARTKGRLELVRSPAGGDGSGCDAVFGQNEAFFTTQVMDGVLVPVCSACHAQGGQAQATRLRVVAGDPAATARSTTLVIDHADPASSLLLAKPLATVPHGGGPQISEGSTEDQVLRQWADLIAQARCTGPPVPTTGPELYAAHCASCHGADGVGLLGRPDVRCTVRSHLTDAVRRGRGTGDAGMPAFTTRQLSDDQVTLIAEHLGGLCSGLPEDIYASNCATCHGPSGEGGRSADAVAGPNIRCKDSGDFDEVLRRGEEEMPAFPSLTGVTATRLARYLHDFCPSGGGDED